MKPISFPEQNDTLGAGNQPGVIDLPVFKDGAQTISCWELSEEEMMEVQSTGRVYLVVQGSTHSPLLVTGHYPFDRPQQ